MNRCIAVMLACLAFATVAAETVYRTRDADGVVRYSDRPPPDAIHIDVIALPRSPLSEEQQAARQQAARERLQQTLETTERLRDDRLAREAARAPAVPEQPRPEGLPPVVIVERNVRSTPWLVPYSPLHPHHRPPFRPPPQQSRPPGPPQREPSQPQRGVDERQFHIPLRRIDP